MSVKPNRGIATALVSALGLMALSACPQNVEAPKTAGSQPPAAQPSAQGTETPAASAQDSSAVVIPAGLTESSFNVEGMTCGDCSASIEQTLIKLPGVSTVAADWKAGTLKVQYDASQTKADDIIAAVDKLAFTCKLAEPAADVPAGEGAAPAESGAVEGSQGA